MIKKSVHNREIIKSITECGILMALGLALSFIKIIKFTQGGSVSLGFLPLLIIAARHGFKKGFICGFGFGFLLMVNEPTILHPIQFLLDYPIAYSCCGIAGLIKWNNGLKATTAITLANLVRLHFHVIAGVIFFIQNEEKTEKALTIKDALIASYGYNCGHLIPETIICAIIVWYIASKHRYLCSQQKLD